MSFEADAVDPEGSTVRYRYTFGDGTAPANGRRQNHTYRDPGTYTATVTATDREGAASTAEVDIVVTPRAVNLAPAVTLSATPQTGTSPLDVAFSAAGTDPEGAALDYRWTFGDGKAAASGSDASYRYRGRGTYTAKVTVTDPEGAKGSAEMEINVTGRNGGS